MRIHHNSSKSVKLQAFRNVIRHGPYCHGQLSTDFLCVLCLELRSPKTTQMPAPPSPREVGEACFSSPVYSALFWDPFEMLFWSPLVAALGLNAAKSTPKTTQF